MAGVRHLFSFIFLVLLGLVSATQEAENRKQALHLRREVLHSKNTDDKDAGSKDDDDDADDDDDDDSDDDDKKDDKKETQSVKTAHKDVMDAEKALYANLHEAADAKLKLVKLADRKGQKEEVDKNIADVAKETQSSSLASFLGDMWTEMRTFARPFYKEHLEEKIEDLNEDRPKLEEELDEAKLVLAEKYEKGKKAQKD